MAYTYTPEPENAVPGRSCVSPKTHTPGSRVEERGHRFYHPDEGRWVSRDPIGERGGINLMVICANKPINHVDKLGLWSLCSLMCPDKCNQGELRLDSAKAMVLPSVWLPIPFSGSAVEMLDNSSQVLDFLGTAATVGYVAGPVVGVSVAATTAILGQFQNWGLSPSAIAQGLYNAQVQASGNFDNFKIWTRVTYKPCKLTECCFGYCSRMNWGQAEGNQWEECGIDADNSLGPNGQSDFIYEGYQDAVNKASRCLAAHIARFAQ